MCQLNRSQTVDFSSDYIRVSVIDTKCVNLIEIRLWILVLTILGSVTGSHASMNMTSLSLCWEFIIEVSHELKRFYDPDLNPQI